MNGLLLSLAFLIFTCFPLTLAAEEPGTNEDQPAEAPAEMVLFENIPVVVTASKKPERITQAPSIISVITEDDIQRMGARNIMDVLRTIPGLEIMRDEANLSQIAVRGLRSATSAGVKILVDGHSLNDPITGGATQFYDDLPLHHIRRIEVIRGPASTIYGTNAFVSVVNILTKSASDIDGLEASVGAGSFQTFNPALLFGKTWRDLEFSVYADYYTTDGTPLEVESDAMSLYDQRLVAQGFEPVSLTPGEFREQCEKLYVSSTFKYADFTLRAGLLDKHRGPFLTDLYTLNTDSTEDEEHVYLDLAYHRFLTQRLELHTRLYADYFQIHSDEQVAPGLTILEDSEDAAEQPYTYPQGLRSTFSVHSWRVGGEHQIHYRLFKHSDLTLGIAYEYLAVEDARLRTNHFNSVRNLDPDVLVDISEFVPDVQTSLYQTSAAIFAQNKWQLRRNIDLTLGLRGDFFSEVGGVVTPKAAIIYEPDPAVNVKALFGSAFRVPSFMETFMERSYQGRPARDALVMEELHTFEIGVSYQPLAWLTGEINYYYSEINELAEINEEEYPKWSVWEGNETYANIGGIDVQGVELELRGRSEREIGLAIMPTIIHSSFRLNYSYQDTQDSTTHEKVPNMARHRANLNLGLTLATEEAEATDMPPLKLFRSFSDRFALSANLFLCGERQRSQADVRDPLPAFAVLDMSLTAFDVFNTGFGLSLSVENLLDTHYHDPSPELTREALFATIPDDFPNPGRTIFLELRYTF